MRFGTYYRYLVVKILKIPSSGKKILDIGGYDGFFLSTLNSESKTLIDISPDNQFNGINYIKGDFLAFDFKDERFDFICAFDVIEHIQRDNEFLERIVQLLLPGGIAILSTPSEKICIFPSVLQDWVDKKWGHVYRRGYSKQKFYDMIVKNDYQNQLDLEIIEWGAPGFRLFYFPLWISWHISESVTKKILNRLITYEDARKNGDNGLLFIIIKKNNV